MITNGELEEIKLTEHAADKILSVLQEEQVHQDEPYLRVGIKAGGCSGFTYTMDFDSRGTRRDLVYESYGIKILCDKKSHLYIKGMEIDWSDDLNDRGFKFNNPIAKTSCGCRTSFLPNIEEVEAPTPSWI